MTVKEEFLKRTPKREIDKKVAAIIREAEREIKIPSLAIGGRRSLLDFYNRQYTELRRSLSAQISMIAALSLLAGVRVDGTPAKVTKAERAAAWQTVERSGYTGARVMGVPMQRYSADYIRHNVQPALDRLADQYPYDPDQLTEQEHRNSLRNKAEMEVRQQEHEDRLNSLRANGTRLVLCSTHADCSERCRPYQGRVYSLDGTRGRTDDGRDFVPLEEATQNPRDRYVTKAGRVWQNGLLSFNCRHFLVEYKSGYHFPKPDVKAERKEYMITETQRRLERNVREWRTRAVEAKGVNPEEYKYARKKAIEWNERYIEYSQKNNRAFYPSRTKLI